MFGQNVYVIPGKYLTSIGIYRQVSFSTRELSVNKGFFRLKE